MSSVYTSITFEIEDNRIKTSWAENIALERKYMLSKQGDGIKTKGALFISVGGTRLEVQ